MRHLTEHQAVAALRRRLPIEQMLSESLGAGFFSWLEALPSEAGFVLRLHHTVDAGSDDYCDVYEFGSVDEDDYLGVGELIANCPDETSLLEAGVAVGAQPSRWVNAGVIQDEYRDLRKRL